MMSIPEIAPYKGGSMEIDTCMVIPRNVGNEDSETFYLKKLWIELFIK